MAVRIDAAADRLSYSGAAPPTTFTVTGWVYLSVDRNDYSAWCRLWAAGNGTVANLAFDADGTAGPWWFSGGGSFQNITGIVVGEWRKVAASRTGSSGVLYVCTDGGSTEVDSGTVGTGTPAGITLGGRDTSDATEWFNGRLAQFRVWDTVLSQAQIEAEWASATPVITSGLWANWPLTTATDLTDTANARTLAVNGGGAVTTEADPPNVPAGTNANAGNAAGTGAALSPTVRISPSAGIAAGTGAALAPSVSTSQPASAGHAAGAGSAAAPTVAIGANAGAATGTGAALAPSVSTSQPAAAGNAAGSGAALSPTVRISPSVGVAAGTGVALAPTVTTPGAANAGVATGTGQAFNPSVATSQPAAAGNAAGAGQAFAPTVAIGPTAGIAQGTGAALVPGLNIGARPGTAAGVGLARDPTATNNAPGDLTVAVGRAAGTGQAFAPTVHIRNGDRGGNWGDLRAILADVRLIERETAGTRPTACINDGEPLVTGPGGVLYCPFDGARY